MDYQYLLMEKKDGVAKITLNRPEVLNAWMAEMRDEVGAAFESLADDDSVRAAVLTGAGRAFCAGHDRRTIVDDLKDPGRREVDAHTYMRIIRAITGLEKPVIAMVNGPATGGGCNLALWCDIVIAAEDAILGQTFVRIGLSPVWACSYLMPRLVGMARAKELLFTGRIINAKEAERIGLIARAVPADQLEATAMGLARELAQGPTKTIAMFKKALHKALEANLESIMLYEAYLEAECAESHDLKEGIRAFLEKRPPQFKGK